MSDSSDTRSDFLYVTLVVRNAQRRRALAAVIAETSHTVVREFGDEPTDGNPARFARLGSDIAIVDLDDDIDRAVLAIESICGLNPAMTVLACSGKSDLAVMRRAMQAGARDFLTEPLVPERVREAFARIYCRRAWQEKAPGKLLVFAAGKGGVGVTSLAANFSVALTKESGARVVVVDMDLQMGDVALGLGLTASCSVADALRNPTRLDGDFLKTLLIRHSSGLAVLSSPEEYTFGTFPGDEAASKLFQLLREEFDYVVVDSGSCHNRAQQELFETADKLYLVTELTFPALRNAHRLISCLSAKGCDGNLEVVLNRHDWKRSDIGEEHVGKALGRSVKWRIPNGHEALQMAWDSGIPMAVKNSPVMAELVQMARAACGKSLIAGKARRMFGLFDRKARVQLAGI
jgi:pilus assembly protein CpaE